MPDAPLQVPRFKLGAVVTTVLVALSLVGVCAAFLLNASPYGTFSDARQTTNSGMHVAGTLVKDSIVHDTFKHEIRFRMKDQKGELAQIVYTGGPQQDLDEATTVVAIGGFHGSVFQSDHLLVKCPSKYEGEKKSLQDSRSKA